MTQHMIRGMVMGIAMVYVAIVLLFFSAQPSNAQSITLSIGARIQTTAKLNVRSTAGGTKIGTQPLGATGTIVAGPTIKKGNTWWKIDYESGVDGWSAQAYLAPVQNSPVPPPTVSLSASPTTVTTGAASNLAWSSTDVSSCTGTNFTASGTSGNVTVSPAQTTTYTITCTGAAGGSASASATVTVSAAGGAISCSLPNYPDASCTGVPTGTVLTVINGDMNITTANTVVDSKDVRGCITINAPGVIIKNSKITCSTAPYAVDVISTQSTWTTIQDSEISCADRTGTTAIGEEGVNVLRSNIHGCENGFDVNRNMSIQDNYIHDLAQGTVAHTDGIQVWNTAQNLTIKHNRIYGFTGGVDGTSAIIGPPVEGHAIQMTIQDNLFAGGAYSLYCPRGDELTGHPAGYDVRILNNRFSTIKNTTVGSFGPWTDCENESQLSGNVYHETGKLLPGQGAAAAVTPTVTLTASPTSITSGQSSTLTWSSANASSCTGTGFTASGTSGSASVSPTANASYSITCTGSGGSANASAAVAVTAATQTNTPPPPTGTTITMGETRIVAGDDSGNGNMVLVQSATLAQAATLQSLSFYVRTAAGNLRLGVYDATGASGGPGNLIAQTDAFTPTTGWNTQTVTAIPLEAGTYWLAYFPSSNSLHFADESTGSYKAASLAFTAMPATYPTPTMSGAAHWSLYATLTSGTASLNTTSQLAATSVAAQLDALKALLSALLIQLGSMSR